MVDGVAVEPDAPSHAAFPAPAVGWASGPLGAVQAADREIARQTARRARAVAAFAATRPASVDRPQGTPGAMSPQRWARRPEPLRQVSEWAAQELAIALLHATGGGGLAERPRLALTDALTGTLLALTDLPTLHRTAACATAACRRHPRHCNHLAPDATLTVTTPTGLVASTTPPPY